MRLYRFTGAEVGDAPDWVRQDDRYLNMMEAVGRWFSDDEEEARWYEREHPGGELVFVDVDDDFAEVFRVSNMALKQGGKDVSENPVAWSLRPDREFFLPRDIAELAAPMGAAVPEVSKRM